MKKTDNSELWQPAPINGKDVSWDFIIENLEQGDRKVAQHPERMAALLYVKGDTEHHYCPVTMICCSSYIHIITVYSMFEVGVKSLIRELCDMIDSDINSDLYVEHDEPEYSEVTHNYSAGIYFYHTDPNH